MFYVRSGFFFFWFGYDEENSAADKNCISGKVHQSWTEKLVTQLFSLKKWQLIKCGLKKSK